MIVSMILIYASNVFPAEETLHCCSKNSETFSQYKRRISARLKVQNLYIFGGNITRKAFRITIHALKIILC